MFQFLDFYQVICVIKWSEKDEEVFKRSILINSVLFQICEI